MADTQEKAHLRNRFIKEELPGIRVEGVDVDLFYIKEVLKRSKERGKVLDIGTGTAHIPIELLRRGSHLEIFAIDLSEASLRIAKENSSGVESIHILRADGYSLPFRESAFDEVIVRLAPHSIREAYRVLKRGGWYIHRACGEYNCRKEIHEVFGDRALPYAEASWWRTTSGRLERYKKRGFSQVYEISFHVRRYYTLDQIIMEMRFNPIVRDFDPEKDRSKLEELKRRYGTEKGIRITGYPLIIFAQK